MARRKDPGQSLLPELANNLPSPARNIRDAINFAEFPLAVYGPRPKTTGVYESTVYRDDGGLEIIVAGNKQLGVEIFYGYDLDFAYGLVSMLYDEHRVGPRELLFPFKHWIERIKRPTNGAEYERAHRFLEKARHVSIRKVLPVINEKCEEQLLTEVFPPLVEHYAILGSVLKRGRKKSQDDTKDGLCRVVFSEWAMNHFLREELSTPLNFDFMISIPTPLGRRIFRFINSIKNREGKNKITRHLLDVGRRIPFTDKNPSHIKRNLDPTHEKLIRLNYLEDVEYSSDGRTPLITWCFSKFNAEQALAIQELVNRRVEIRAAEELASSKPAKFILDVVRLFDISKKEKRVFDAGWIVKVIKTGDPGSIEQSLERYKEAARKTRPRSAPREPELQRFYEQELAEKLAEAKKNLTLSELSGYEARARTKVHENAACLGDWAYKLGIESAVDKLIQEDLKIPSFEQWLDQRRKENSRG